MAHRLDCVIWRSMRACAFATRIPASCSTGRGVRTWPVTSHAFARCWPATTSKPFWGLPCGGIGIACLPDFLVRDALAEGRLVSVLEPHLGPACQFRALWPSSRHLSPKVRVWVDHLGAQLSSPP